jgi:two-component system, OmpR family, phosphate regulon sensor histidine kinase PhoR
MSVASTATWSRERLLLALLDEADEPLLALDDEGRIVECNAAAAQLLQRTRSHLRGKPFAVCISLEDRRRFREALVQLPPRDARVADLSLRLVHGETEVATASVRLRLLQGPPPLLLTSLRHTARARRTRRPARQEHFDIERYLLRLPLGVIGIDMHGRLLFANGRARRSFGMTQLRRGLPLPQLGDSVSFERHLEQLLTRGLSIQPELHELPDGRVLRIAAAAVREASFCVLTIDDVTAILRDARAEYAFVRNAAHQLRTPLASMSTAIEVLQSGAKDDPEARARFLAHLATGVERLSRLTRALLVLARSQTGTQPARLELVDLEPVFTRLVGDVSPAAEVKLAVGCKPGLRALAEPDLLEEAIGALLDNAARHTREGVITVRATRRDDHTVEVEVEDSGEGILPEHQEHVFEPFYRPVGDGNGFGLGLAIASQAIAAMGAKLEVESSPQHGSRFWFRLPSAELRTSSATHQ